MTLSPPANVKDTPDDVTRALASGIDSLVISMQIEWQSDRAFKKLAKLKGIAKTSNDICSGRIIPNDGSERWLFGVRPSGTQGYEWMLTSAGMDVKLGDWLKPISRPSAMVEFRSEALWTHGPQAMLNRAIVLLQSVGARIVEVKISRADLCCDMLLPESTWTAGLVDQFVTRAKHSGTFRDGRQLEGFMVGRGVVVARLYDKPLEIRKRQNKKQWMYDVWRLEEVPDGCRIIRVEFQLRREVLKELHVHSLFDLQRQAASVWAYCTQNWLKVQHNADKHHTQQTTVDWWRIVQHGYTGAQRATPAIRDKAVRCEIEQHARAILGHASSITALQRQGEAVAPDELLDIDSHMQAAIAEINRLDVDDSKYTKTVKKKQTRFARSADQAESPMATDAEMVSSSDDVDSRGTS